MSMRTTIVAALEAWAGRYEDDLAPGTPEQMADAYRAEVLREGAEALRAENRRILWATKPDTCADAEFLDRMANGEQPGKDTSDAAQAPAGESTQPTPRERVLTHRWADDGQPHLTIRLAFGPEYTDQGVEEITARVRSAARHGFQLAEKTETPALGGPFVPRTEREHWVDIADALNAAGAAGIAVGIDMEGILTDHTAWAVVWNREQQRWEVGGYEDDSPAESPADAEDWVICCSPKPRCPNGERRARAVERGWTQNGRAGNWLCAEHSPDFFQPGRTYADTEPDKYDWRFRCDTVTTHPDDGQRTALGWRHFRGEWTPCAYGEDDWDINRHVGITTDGGR